MNLDDLASLNFVYSAYSTMVIFYALLSIFNFIWYYLKRFSLKYTDLTC